jgi:hypothetical protein
MTARCEGVEAKAAGEDRASAPVAGMTARCEGVEAKAAGEDRASALKRA